MVDFLTIQPPEVRNVTHTFISGVVNFCLNFLHPFSFVLLQIYTKNETELKRNKFNGWCGLSI